MRKRLKFILVMALPYALIILLPILTNLCLGSMIVAYYHDKIIIDKQKSIESAFERFVQRMDNIESLSYIIASNKEVTRYAYGSIRGSEHSLEENIKMKDLLNNFLINNDLITMYIYDPGDNRILTTDAVISDATNYFKYKFCMEGYIPAESVERIKSLSWGNSFRPVVRATIDNVSSQIIEYSLSIPLDRDSKFQLQLVMVMDAEDILGDLYDVLDENSEFYLYDNSGQLIFGEGTRYRDSGDVHRNIAGMENASELSAIYADGEQIYQMTCYSPDKFWKLDMYMPDLMKNGSSGGMTPFVWLLIGVSIIVSIAFCIYFTYRKHREIEEVLKLFKGRYKAEDGEAKEQVGYKAIKEYADKIIKDNDRFKERIVGYEYLCKYEVLDKLLRNTYQNRETMEKALQDTNLSIRNEKCVILCIRYEGSGYRSFITEDVAIKDIVRALLADAIESKVEIFDTAARETICVLTIEDEQSMEMTIRDIISKLNVEIAYGYGIEMKIGVGNIVESVYYINESYTKVKETIRYSETSGKNVLFYSELARLEDVYYYPREYDEKIYNYMVAGRTEEAKEIVESLYKENFEQNSRMLSARAIEILKSRLGDALLSIAEKYDVSTERVVIQLDQEQNINQFFIIIYDFIDIIAEEIKKKKKSLQNHSVVKMMNYIQENYSDNTLSLKQISQKFNLHETYISRLFKAEYGENLSGIIEKLRIEKACELIKDTDTKISDIAEKVGYTSDLSFRRAFKKVTGMNPGEYRENKV